MRIKQVIKRLREIQKEHGNIHVYCWPYDGQGKNYLVGDFKMATDGSGVFLETSDCDCFNCTYDKHQCCTVHGLCLEP